MLLILLLCQGAFGDWYHSTLAFSLAASNLQQHLGKDRHVCIYPKQVVLDFFTPWCIYCQHMAGEFNQVFEHYRDSRADILIAKMNCDEEQNQHICHQFGVHSFPTILYFPPGQDRPTSQFQNHRRYDFFVQWIDSLAQMSEEMKKSIQQQEYEKLLKEQEQQELRLKELLEQEQIKQMEVEEQQRKEEEEIKISEQIQSQIQDVSTYMETLKHMEKEINLLQQQLGEANQKIVVIKKQPKVNWDHVLVFGTCGLLLGIALTSCACMFQKTNHVNIEKAI